MFKKTTKIFLAILFFISISFIFQNRIRDIFFKNSNQITDTADIEKTLLANSRKCNTCIIPKEWYAEGGYMNPLIAGFVDGAWQSGVSFVQIVNFVKKYATDTKFYNKANSDIEFLYANKAKLPAQIKNEFIKLGKGIAGDYGANRAEYLFGKCVFEFASLSLSGGAIIATTGKKAVKLTKKSVSLLKRTKLVAKINKLAKICKPCAKLLKNSGGLRRNLLNKKNTVIAKKLLKSEWELAQKKGIKWKDFIKDYQAHHIIPKELLNTSEGLQFYFNNGGKLKFNSIDNGMMLKKVNVGGVHAKHNKYNDFIAGRISRFYNDIKDLPISSDKKIKLFDDNLNIMLTKTRSKIIEKSIKNNIKINSIY